MAGTPASSPLDLRVRALEERLSRLEQAGRVEESPTRQLPPNPVERLMELVRYHRAEADRLEQQARDWKPIKLTDDRYDGAHPEEEHDGGLGSGDWMKEA